MLKTAEIITCKKDQSKGARVLWDNTYDEYRVRVYPEGFGAKHYEPAEYFTNDRDDAIQTARIMVEELNAKL